MRDPSRIEIMLNALHEAWLKNLDMRLGQLFVNLTRVDEPCPQVFNFEDDQLLTNMRDWLAKSESGELHNITVPVELKADELRIRGMGKKKECVSSDCE